VTAEAQPFLVHLYELRRRLQYCLLFVILGSIVGYVYYPQILSFLLRPLHEPLYYSSPTGGFELLLKISLSTGVLCAIPMFIYQALRFLEPVLPIGFSRSFKYYVLASAGLLVIGMSFAFFVSIPSALHFLAGLGGPDVNALISTQEYFSFLVWYLVGFGFIFQMPLIFLGINAIRPLPVRRLLGASRYVILGSFILAAIFGSAPDVFNQAMFAIPIILLYYVSVFLIWCISK
jgi:sec-independent protein translocase protein TatC